MVKKKIATKAPQKGGFRTNLIIIAVVVVLLFLVALLYSSYQGNIAGEASKKPKKSGRSSSSSSSGGIGEKSPSEAPEPALVAPVNTERDPELTPPPPPGDNTPQPSPEEIYQRCLKAADAAGVSRSNCDSKKP